MNQWTGQIPDDFSYRPSRTHRQLSFPGVSSQFPALEAPPGGAYGAPAAAGHGTLGEYFRILFRHKWLVAFPGVGLALLAFAYSSFQKPVYRAKASLEILNVNDSFLNSKDLDPASTVTGTDYVQTQVKILESRTLQQRVASKVKSRPELSKETARWALPALARWVGPPTPINLERELRSADKKLSVRGSGFNRLVELEFESESPKIAAAFVNTLAEEFINQSVEVRWNTTQRTGNWLSKQLDLLRTKLEAGERQLEAYASQSDLRSYTVASEPIAEQSLRQLQQELSQAKAERIMKQTEAELAKMSRPEALRDVLDDPVMRDYQSKLSELNRSRAELSASLTTQHPKVARVNAQIAEIQRAMAEHRTAIVNRIGSDYERATRREKLLEQAFIDQSKVLQKLAEKGIRYNILKREVDTTRQIYETMLQRVKEAGITSALHASNIRLVDTAEPPRSPVKPDFFMNTALAGLFGGMIGIAGVISLEKNNRKLTTTDECVEILNLRPLGLIPKQPASVMASRVARLSDGGSGAALPVVSRRSMYTEALHSVLLSMQLGQDSEAPRVVAVTSPGPREGKSTISMNLAGAAALMGSRVLLIDGDMRCPVLDQRLNLAGSKGLSDILASTGQIVSAKTYARATSIPDLEVIPSGDRPSDVMRLLQSPRLEELIAAARIEYDFVVIDTPPVLQIADARLLARPADGVALVLRADHSTSQGALMARDILWHDRIRILGVIMNGWETEKMLYGYPRHKYYQET